MANVKISGLNDLLTVSGDDLLVFTDSGSLTTFRTPVSSINTYFSLSGSSISSSWASSSLTADSASFNESASYSHKSSVGNFLYYDGTNPNGTASYVLSSSVSLTSSYVSFASASRYSITTSFTRQAITASTVATSSFAQLTQAVLSASTAVTTSLADTASYIDLSIALNIPKWYGPLTSSGHSGSAWGWSDPVNQGIPIIVLQDNTNLICQVSARVLCSRFADTNAVRTIEVRMLPITQSSLPGYYTVPTASSTIRNADDWVASEASENSDVNGSRVGGRDYLLMFNKSVNRGSYILWVENRIYEVDSVFNTNQQETIVGNPDAPGFVRVPLDTATASFDRATREVWLKPISRSLKSLIYADYPVQQGIMLTPTHSAGMNAGQVGNWGRVYAFPFLVNSSSLVTGFCSASFSYLSGSTQNSAQFSASTTGLEEDDVVYSFLGGLANVASHWTTSTVVSGIALSSVPIRTEVSSSWLG